MVRPKIKDISASNEAMLLKLGRNVAPYEMYSMAHILMLLWKYGRFLSPASPKFNITICDSTRQNTWCYLRCMPVPPSIGSSRLNIFCIFCPVQLQMVIFEFEDERDRACCQSKIKMCTMCTFRRVQHPCQVSVALSHCWQRYS